MSPTPDSGTTPSTQRELHRARYEALRLTAQTATAKALPPRSPLDTPPAGPVLHRETIPGGWYWTTRLRPGESLRVATPTGTSSVAMIAWSVADSSERINVPDTIKLQWSAALRKGRLLLTDMGHVAFSIVEDSSGAHDTVIGPTTRASTEKALGADAGRNSRDNFLAAASKLGLSRRDVPMCVSFFAPVAVDAQGRFVWHADRRRPGDFIDLRAEMDLWVVLSNAGHPLDPSPRREPSPVELTVFESPMPTANDACRNAGVEAERAFVYTGRLASRVAMGDHS
jgi:urea carboxylase-associated protein 2